MCNFLGRTKPELSTKISSRLKIRAYFRKGARDAQDQVVPDGTFEPFEMSPVVVMDDQQPCSKVFKRMRTGTVTPSPRPLLDLGDSDGDCDEENCSGFLSRSNG